MPECFIVLFTSKVHIVLYDYICGGMYIITANIKKWNEIGIYDLISTYSFAQVNVFDQK